ncbi:MAG: hypothetical protein GX074_04065 [Erysipelothrix sp.]|nr:hypothetical protein [Erysipelothrix sp.]
MYININQGSFLTDLSNFASLLLPVVGLVALILVCWLLWEVVKTVKGLDTTFTKVNSTIDSVDKTIQMLEPPLKTVANVGQSVDDVLNFVRYSVVEKSVNLVTDNFEIVKDWASGLFKKTKKNDKQTAEEIADIDIDSNIEI